MSNNELLNLDLTKYDKFDEYELSREQREENAIIELKGALQDIIHEAKQRDLEDEYILKYLVEQLNIEFKFNQVEIYNRPMSLRELEKAKQKARDDEEFCYRRIQEIDRILEELENE